MQQDVEDALTLWWMDVMAADQLYAKAMVWSERRKNELHKVIDYNGLEAWHTRHKSLQQGVLFPLN
jgi:cbb3-type cytochrome oxidase cytochrome c subunit